jgi:hypothetical protein
MKVSDRDLRWNEWIRRRYEDLKADVVRLEERWRRRANPANPKAERLRAHWILWTLGTTVRELRDQSTRALYWFGRSDPAGLFRLTLHALMINDPYVSERALAAAYGVSMALHCRPKRKVFHTQTLPVFAKRVYREMFAPAAEHSTTHALSRDYARRILQLAHLHDPSLLTKGEWARTVPPFKDGGIRNWDVIDDPAEGKYRAGNAPLGMDFENYTIGNLVPSRQNDYQNEEYKRVVGQITWRIYQLGYTLEAFGEVDKAIADTRYFGRSERPSIERYGKKYARIAYFEQYGFREDQGLLKSDWRHSADRPSDADIDPSFPGTPRKTRLMSDFLGDRSTHIRDWVENGPTPVIRPHLVPAIVDNKSGPWVLLKGYCSQEDKSTERVGSVMIRSLLMLQEDVNEFTRLIKKDSNKSWSRSESGQEDDAFAGEIPWCDTFHHTELSTLDFEIGKVKVPISQTDLRYRLSVVFDIGGVKHTVQPSKAPEFEEIPKYRKIVTYLPFRHNSFSSAAGIERPSADVPSKELAEHFSLWLNLPSWHMLDGAGRQCTIYLSDGEYFDTENYLFIRKDLIDSFLSSQKLSLVWVVRGERQHFTRRDATPSHPSQGHRYFHQAYLYTPQGRIRSLM